jgi:hypothetical protein
MVQVMVFMRLLGSICRPKGGKVMNRIRIALVSMLLLGLTAFCYAQNPGQQSRPLNQEEPRHPEAAPPPQQPEGNPPQGQEEAKPPRSQEEKPAKPEKQEEPKAKEHPKTSHEEHGQPAQQGHARPAGKSAHIPDPKFKANFTRQHTFTVNRVITQTTIIPNQTQFVYGGYTFIFLDPWPADWVFTDECYIDFLDDEYFLIDVLHPGVRVALFVVG